MEHVAFNFVGGPDPGLHQCRIKGWPPPSSIDGDVYGRYVLQGYSQLPEGTPNVLRGATYEYKLREEN